jgi:hypothetical protein
MIISSYLMVVYAIIGSFERKLSLFQHQIGLGPDFWQDCGQFRAFILPEGPLLWQRILV